MDTLTDAGNFHALAAASSLHDGYVRTFEVDGFDLVLVQHSGVPHVLEGICPHAGHPLSAARLIEGALRCDMHGYLFDVRSGTCTHYTEGPCRALRVHQCTVREGMVGVLL